MMTEVEQECAGGPAGCDAVTCTGAPVTVRSHGRTVSTSWSRVSAAL